MSQTSSKGSKGITDSTDGDRKEGELHRLDQPDHLLPGRRFEDAVREAAVRCGAHAPRRRTVDGLVLD